jgi:hypothetical protein
MEIKFKVSITFVDKAIYYINTLCVGPESTSSSSQLTFVSTWIKNCKIS